MGVIAVGQADGIGAIGDAGQIPCPQDPSREDRRRATIDLNKGAGGRLIAGGIFQLVVEQLRTAGITRRRLTVDGELGLLVGIDNGPGCGRGDDGVFGGDEVAIFVGLTVAFRHHQAQDVGAVRHIGAIPNPQQPIRDGSGSREDSLKAAGRCPNANL